MLTWLLFFNTCYIGDIVQINLKARFEELADISQLKLNLTKLIRRVRAIWIMVGWAYIVFNLINLLKINELLSTKNEVILKTIICSDYI